MTDPLERSIAGLDGPRALDPAFRARLESAILDDTSPGIAAPAAGGRADGWAIDGPRELTPRFRARLEGALLRRSRVVPPFVTTVAAAVSVILIATGVVFVADRAGRPGKEAALPLLTPSPTPPAVATKAPAAANPSGSLRGFSSASEFLGYVRGEALKVVSPYGIGSIGVYRGFSGPVTGPVQAPGIAPESGGPGGAPVLAPSSPAGGSDFSATNVQEEGVDEPDLVKTDGKRLAVVSGSALRLLDVTRSTARLRGSVSIENGLGAFLAGDRAIVFSQLDEAPPEARQATHVKQRPWTKVTVVDVDDLSKPRVLSAFEVEGSYVGARMANGVVRLIIQSGALGPQPVELTSYSKKAQDAAKAGNKSAILGSVVGDWMPHFVVHRRSGATTTGHVHDWSAVSRPPDRSGVSMLTILTIDPANPRPDNAQSVMGAGEIVYSSLENLYVTSYALDDVLAVRESKRPKEPLTRIHKFDIRDRETARYVGSGEVPGFLLNQFSMSEHNGYLRVATTTGNQWVATGAPSSESAVTVLAEKAGKLVSVGSVRNLGLGERIFSVRFIGSMGYVVTFRRIDPLFVIDLRKPARPRVRGKLKIEGFSEYLHPISESLLLGVGREADKQGVAKGLQFSLFDVSDPTKPRRLHNHIEGPYGYSGVGNDHHAFLYWEPRRLIVVNASVSDTWSDHTDFIGALALTVSSSQGFGEPIRLTHVARPGVPEGSYPDIQRSLVIGNRLLTVSSSGVLVSDLVTLDDRAWVPFES